MLTSLRLTDWKSFGDGVALPFGRVTLLVGPNGSGKSNLLDALKFLQGAALDLPLGDVLRGRYEGQREVWPGIRGGTVEAVRTGRQRFDLTTTWADDLHYYLAIELGARGRTTVREEWLATRGQRIFQVPSADAVDDTRLALTQLGSQPGAPAAEPQQRLQRRLREQIVLDVQPAKMTAYQPIGALQLGVNAENVSPILHQLRDRDPAQLQHVVDWLSELCAPAIETIDFDRTSLDEVMMFFIERGGATISARSASDGTLRFLGLIVALLTVPEGSMIIIEESDVGLHPSRIHLLASLLEDTARRRSLQIVATTHSPTLLAHLSDEALAAVLAFGRDPDDGTTIGKRVGDLPHFATLRDSRNLEHLVSTGWLERAL